MLRGPEFKPEYGRVLQEHIQMGHIGRSQDVIRGQFQDTYYLPQHAAIYPDSTATKVRVVFNASVPSSNGVSLIGVLRPGPVL